MHSRDRQVVGKLFWYEGSHRAPVNGCHGAGYIVRVVTQEKSNDGRDVRDIQLQVCLRIHQMRTLSTAAQRGGVDLVTKASQPPGYASPAPAAVPGAMDEHVILLFHRRPPAAAVQPNG